MKLYEKILSGEEKIALVGLGYVGMPIAVEFSKHVKVIGFDINKPKVEAYKRGEDPTQEVGNEVNEVLTRAGLRVRRCFGKITRPENMKERRWNST